MKRKTSPKRKSKKRKTSANRLKKNISTENRNVFIPEQTNDVPSEIIIELADLFQIGNQDISLKAYIMRMVNIIHRAIAYDVISIKFLDLKSDQPRYRYICDKNGDYIDPETILLEEKISKKVIRIKKELFEAGGQSLKPFQGFFGVPLIFQGKVVGVISILLKKKKVLTKAQLSIMRMCASNLSLLLHRVEHISYSEQSYYKLFRALITSLEAKDRYTCGHTQRVASYSLKVAEKMNCNKEELEVLEEAAHLHDIGKIAIPDSILNKPGRLTPEEFKEIQSHVIKGEVILKALGFNEEVILIACAHHECYNGQGYPNKWKGEEIPLLARIINVADAYDAMTSDRPYRKALSKEFAYDQLRQCAGVQFCPKVVEAFLEINL